MALRFEFASQLPPAYAALLWDVFFVQRGRGLSLEEHFPWIVHPQGGASFATLSDGDALLAGLIVRPCSPMAAAVGLVCVHPAYRGQGLSTQLLQQTLVEVDRLGHAATTLWTGKPTVYERHGFVPRDDGVQYQVSDWQAGPASAPARRWPDAAESASQRRGLPAYAHHGLRVGTTRAELLLLQDPLGMALAEWQGEDADVIELLAAVMPRRWRLSALQGDTLPAVLAARGAAMAASPQQLQMWRLRPGVPSPELPRLRLLDRI